MGVKKRHGMSSKDIIKTLPWGFLIFCICFAIFLSVAMARFFSPVHNLTVGDLKGKNKIQEIVFAKELSSPRQLYFEISIRLPSGKKSSKIHVCPYRVEKNEKSSFLQRRKVFYDWKEIIYLSPADLEKVKAEKQEWEKANPPPDIHLLDEE